MSNGFLNCGDKFCHAFQNSWIWIFILQCVSLMCLKLLDIGWIIFLKLKKHWINGMWIKFIMLWTFKKFFYDIFYMSYSIMTWNWNGKKCYFQYNVDIHILSQFSTTLGKDFEKGFNLLKLRCGFTFI
jgi:hypothetical protein